MDFVKQLLADSLNGFALRFLPLFIFQLFCAALFTWLLAKVWKMKFKSDVLKNSVLISVGITVIVSIVKYSMPGSVLVGAVLLLFLKKNDSSKHEIIGQLLVMIVSIGCGLGSIFQVFIGLIVISTILLFLPLDKSEG